MLTFLCWLAACADDGSDTGADTHKDKPSRPTGPEDSEDPCVFAATISAEDLIGPLPFTGVFSADTRCAPGDWTAHWDFGDGETAEGTTATHTWLASGDYTVTVSATSGDAIAEGVTPVRVTAPDCPAVGTPTQVGALANVDLLEASGLVLTPDGLLWSHNDSGDVARLFALDPDGADRGTFVLDGAPDGDWEDLAVDLGEDPPVLYVGDIGQNGGARATSTIYRVPEPDKQIVSNWTSFELVFPDGDALDANTMMLDPATGDLYLVADEGAGTYAVFRAEGPFADGDLAPLTRLTGFSLAEAPTGGSFSPLGDQLAIRTLDEAWLFLRDQTGPVEDAWSVSACTLALGDEPAGEAIALTGDAYYTTGEGLNHPIFATTLTPPPDPCDGLTAALSIDAPSFEVPFSPTFSVDTACLLAEPETVTWDLGDGDTATGPTATKTWLSSGTYRVAAEIVDTEGVTWLASTTFDVVGATCPTPGTTETWGTVVSEDIVEASGLATSLLDDGILWTHNDSGDSPRLFALGTDGSDLGQYAIETDNTDWEDIALGYDAILGGPAIYVGDFGDNGEVRDHVAVLVVLEPTVDPEAPVETELTGISTLTMVYPDGAHNAETLMVDPVTGDLYVVTKSTDGVSDVYRKPAPHEDGTETELELVANLTFGEDPLSGSERTTAGDFSPLGDRIAIRTYDHAYMWRRDQAYTVAHALADDPCDLGAPDEPQGEAFAFTRDGKGYVTLSEGLNQPIYYTPLN